MAFQSVWYFTDLPKKVVDIIVEDLSENFDESMVGLKSSQKTLTRKNEILRILGFQLIIGFLVLFGIM